MPPDSETRSTSSNESSAPSPKRAERVRSSPVERAASELHDGGGADDRRPTARWFAIAFLVLAAVRLWRYATFSDGFDTALLMNVLWRTGAGLDSVTALTGSPYISTHVSGVLYALAPLHRLAPDLAVGFTLVLPALSVVLAVWALHRLAIHLSVSPALHRALVVASLAGPWTYYASQLEINEPTFGVGPLAMAAVAVLEGRRRRTVIAWAVVAASMRIEMAAAVLLLGVVLLTARRKGGGAVVTVGAAATGVSLWWLFTSSLDTASVAAHFAHLGGSPTQVVTTALTHPLRAAEPLLDPRPWLSLVFWLLPFGLLTPLRDPRWLIPTLPTVGVALFGVWPPADAFVHHYWYSLLGMGGIAALTVAARRVDRQTFQARSSWMGLVAGWVIFALVPIPNLLPQMPGPSADRRAIVSVAEQLPGYVSAPASIAAHLGDRQLVAPLPRPFVCVEEGIGPYIQPGLAPDLVVVDAAQTAAYQEVVGLDLEGLLDRAYEPVERRGSMEIWALRDRRSVESRLEGCQ